jgi:uncharacterized SAM-binding protein YcdF (DUF218 family)
MRSADAIVLLGCRIAPTGLPTGAAARRIAAAARAYHRGLAPLVIVSGGRRWGGHVEAIALHRALVDAGVPDPSILDELCSFSTCDNAIFTTALLRARSGLATPRAAIATCPWHLPRALQLFRAAGADPLPVPTEPSPGTVAQRAYRIGHELVCRALDARTMRRATSLRESAAAYFHQPLQRTFLGEAP